MVLSKRYKQKNIFYKISACGDTKVDTKLNGKACINQFKMQEQFKGNIFKYKGSFLPSLLSKPSIIFPNSENALVR